MKLPFAGVIIRDDLAKFLVRRITNGDGKKDDLVSRFLNQYLRSESILNILIKYIIDILKRTFAVKQEN